MTSSKSLSAGTSLALALLTLPLISEAAKAPLSPEALQKQSTHIVTGEVLEITSSVEKSKVEKRGINVDRIYKITILVESVAKGEGVAKGNKILVLAWRPSTRIPALPGLQGHEGIPEKGDRVTLFLQKLKDQEAFEPLLPNGIETKE